MLQRSSQNVEVVCDILDTTRGDASNKSQNKLRLALASRLFLFFYSQEAASPPEPRNFPLLARRRLHLYWLVMLAQYPFQGGRRGFALIVSCRNNKLAPLRRLDPCPMSWCLGDNDSRIPEGHGPSKASSAQLPAHFFVHGDKMDKGTATISCTWPTGLPQPYLSMWSAPCRVQHI